MTLSSPRILIIEDNISFALDLEMKLTELGYSFQTTSNADEAISKINSNRPDIILTDIYLKGDSTGFDVATVALEEEIPLIFMSAYNDENLYNKAQSILNAFFLIKPFDIITLHSVVQQALNDSKPASPATSSNEPDDFLFIKNKNLLEKVFTSKIIYLQSDGNYCYIQTIDKKLAVKATLGSLVEKLSDQGFIQIHRSYGVPISQIKSIDMKNSELMLGEKVFPIGRKFRRALLEKVKILG